MQPQERSFFTAARGDGAAGQVIRSFGQFVVGGNYVVGVIIFLILVLINFMVITKGSGRIAEVAARFTLDAMPGKQMAIDADLNTGLLSEEEAKEKRILIQKEADYFGAMDGASKFVRGDATAGLIITVINIIGGLLIGVFQQGMPAAEAATVFTILTIGDGLVSQIPSLIISTAAGLIVSRAGGAGELSSELYGQLFFQHQGSGYNRRYSSVLCNGAWSSQVFIHCHCFTYVLSCLYLKRER